MISDRGNQVGIRLAVRARLSSRPCDDQIDVVLHRLGPVVHEVLVDVVGVEQRGVRKVSSKSSERVSISALGWSPMVMPFRRGVLAFFHFANSAVTGCVEGGELGMAEDGGLDLAERRPSAGCSRGGRPF